MNQNRHVKRIGIDGLNALEFFKHASHLWPVLYMMQVRQLKFDVKILEFVLIL